MACIPFRVGDATGFICTRGQRSKPCSTPGCHGAARYQCDYPLTGKSAGKTCDVWLCENCRVPQGKDRDYCGAHTRVSAPVAPMPRPPRVRASNDDTVLFDDGED